MKKLVPPIVVLAALAALAAGCGGGGGPKSVPQSAVAVVGDATISKGQFDKLLNAAKRGYKRQKRDFPKPGTEQYAVIRGQLVQNLVENAEYEQKAKDLGIKVSDDEVDKRLDQIKKQYFGGQPGKKPKSAEEIEKAYRAQIASQGLTDADVRYFVRIQLIREKIYKKVTSDVKVSSDDAKKYYDKHKKQYETPAQPESREIRHILVKNKALADKIYSMLQANAKDFPKLAKKYSIDTQTKAFGGRLPGGVFRGKTVAPFDKVAFSLKTNQISKPVHTQFGWHIIQALSGIKAPTPPKPTPYSQVKDAIKQQLLQQKRQQAVQKWWNDTQKDFRHKIAYQQGYAPPKTAASATTTA